MYLALIDILRFISSLGVMLYHYFGKSINTETTNYFAFFIKHGGLGVQLFFIISGLVIYFSINKDIKGFISSRFSRIYPIFWILCSFTYIFTTVFTPDSSLPFLKFLRNLLIIGVTKVQDSVDGSYWSLTIELLFYAYICSFVYIFKKERLELFYTGWLLASLALFSLNNFDGMIAKILLIRYAPYFIFGGILGLCINEWKKVSKYVLMRRSLLMAISMFSIVYMSHKLNNETSSGLNSFGVYDKPSTVYVLSFFLIVTIAAIISLRIKNIRLIKVSKMLGGITYPLYLVHQKVGEIIIEKLHNFNSLVISMIVTIIMIVISYWVSVKEIKLRIFFNKLSYNILSRIENKLKMLLSYVK